jgi:hypothetical protein
VIVRTPSGGAATLEAKNGVVLFDGTSQAGIYRYTAGDAERYFAVSLSDARESDVDNRWKPGEGRDGTQAAGAAAQALVPLWPWLLVLALALLTLEWCVWAGRRGRA